MITWIKFSERQPEKGGVYLCLIPSYNFGAGIHGAVWFDGKFWSSTDKGKEIFPDYWAEINPPETPKETPMSEKPLCKLCEWCRSTYYCVNIKLEHVVDCEGPPLYLCSLARANREHFCGPEGRWFEAKGEASPPDGSSITNRVLALENRLAALPCMSR